jgi:ribonuclease D
MTIHIHQDDLPAEIDLGDVVAIDTETMGLKPASRSALPCAAIGR